MRPAHPVHGMTHKRPRVFPPFCLIKVDGEKVTGIVGQQRIHATV